MVTRNVSRIASILEIADEQCVRIRDDIESYENDVREKITNGEAQDLHIDNVSLNEYIKLNKDMLAFLKALSEKSANAEISYISAEPYIEQLAFLGVTTLGGLEDLLNANKDVALRLADRMFMATDLDIISSNAGLRFICRAELINNPEKYSEEDIVKFMSITYGAGERAEKQAKRLKKLSSEV